MYTVQSGGGHEYDGDQFESNWLLLGYASLSEDQLRAGIDRLAELLTDNDLLQPRGYRAPLAPS
ncbi:DNA-binding transcriptional MocR family regulator [Rhodopseudomonas rhenobacensis]|uniref:DNA-binding transcriptional MocR family regulator n=1 Tax=Rhodopseudomonas rhenobacensis TaxID=87461 RepID=A0A7W8E0K6_9BRAD|nr:hypothetical protein [Rhodopseudomonas rhenobacensis]MBB5048980.1 DNA-binding transcriptional MocR family regulator [Rhodopseudomonas rhenobacensis]